MSTPDKKRRKPRADHRAAHRLRKIIDLVDDINLAMTEQHQEFEVIRRVWEMRFDGLGPTEIQRRLSVGPLWARRTKRQVEEILRPAELRVQDLLRDRQGKTNGNEDGKLKKAAAADQRSQSKQSTASRSAAASGIPGDF